MSNLKREGSKANLRWDVGGSWRSLNVTRLWTASLPAGSVLLWRSCFFERSLLSSASRQPSLFFLFITISKYEFWYPSDWGFAVWTTKFIAASHLFAVRQSGFPPSISDKVSKLLFLGQSGLNDWKNVVTRHCLIYGYLFDFSDFALLLYSSSQTPSTPWMYWMVMRSTSATQNLQFVYKSVTSLAPRTQCSMISSIFSLLIPTMRAFSVSFVSFITLNLDFYLKICSSHAIVFPIFKQILANFKACPRLIVSIYLPHELFNMFYLLFFVVSGYIEFTYPQNQWKSSRFFHLSILKGDFTYSN